MYKYNNHSVRSTGFDPKYSGDHSHKLIKIRLDNPLL